MFHNFVQFTSCTNTRYYTYQLHKLKYIAQSNSLKLLNYIMQGFL